MWIHLKLRIFQCLYHFTGNFLFTIIGFIAIILDHTGYFCELVATSDYASEAVFEVRISFRIHVGPIEAVSCVEFDC